MRVLAVRRAGTPEGAAMVRGTRPRRATRPVRLGLRANAAQFTLLVAVNALVVIALGEGFGGWAAGAVLLGAGTAMVYPTLLAVVGDVAHPAWRGRAVGVYRVWRDLGYAVGAVLGGIVADPMGLHAAVWAAAGISAVSALVVAVRMYETHRWAPATPRD
jgi:MFS family permease